MRNGGKCLLLLAVLILLAGYALAAANTSANLTNITAPISFQSCASTAQCSSGFCSNGTCLVPEVPNFAKGGACNTTGDCGEGFCSNRTCIIPLPATAIFEFGAKPACAPIIECAPATPCIMICDALWLLLFLFSFIAGYAARKEKNKLIPIILLLIPLAMGFFIYPIVGILIAVVEIILFFSKKKEEQPAEAGFAPPQQQAGIAPQAPLQGPSGMEEPPPPMGY